MPANVQELLSQRNALFKTDRAQYDALSAPLSERMIRESEIIEIVPDAQLGRQNHSGWRQEPLSKWIDYLSDPSVEQVLGRSRETIAAQISTGVFSCFALTHPEFPGNALSVAYGSARDKICQSYAEAFSPVGTEPPSAVTLCSVATPTQFLSLGLPQHLLKQVVENAFPKTWDVATLSPMPKFRQWLDELLANPENEESIKKTMQGWGVSEAALARLKAASGKTTLHEAMASSLAGWAGTKEQPKTNPEPMPEALKKPFEAVTLSYLRGFKPGSGKDGKAHSLNDVYDLHVGERGATLSGFNVLGDPSPEGMAKSYGTLVNYWSRGTPVPKFAEHDGIRRKLVTDPAHSRW